VPEHRLESRGREVNGVKFYNDSKATNVDAAIKCIEAFTAGVNVILGGASTEAVDYSRARRSGPRPLLERHPDRPRPAEQMRIAAALPNTAPGAARFNDGGKPLKSDCEIGKPGEIVSARPGLRQLRHVRQLRAPRQECLTEAVRRLM